MEASKQVADSECRVSRLIGCGMKGHIRLFWASPVLLGQASRHGGCACLLVRAVAACMSGRCVRRDKHRAVGCEPTVPGLAPALSLQAMISGYCLFDGSTPAPAIT